MKQIDFLKDISESARRDIFRLGVEQAFPSGKEILLQGDPCTGVYIVLAGRALVYRSSPEGREQVLSTVDPGRLFNLAPAVQADGRNPANVRALDDTRLLFLRTSDFIILLEVHADLSLTVMRSLADHLEEFTNLVENLALRPVRGRVARFLLDQAEHPDGMRAWTQDEIADRLGTVRDMIGRVLRSFEDGGLIRRERQHIFLRDRKGLEAEANR